MLHFYIFYILEICKTYIKSGLLYTVETWNRTKRNTNKVKARQMIFLRCEAKMRQNRESWKSKQTQNKTKVC